MYIFTYNTPSGVYRWRTHDYADAYAMQSALHKLGMHFTLRKHSAGFRSEPVKLFYTQI